MTSEKAIYSLKVKLIRALRLLSRLAATYRRQRFFLKKGVTHERREKRARGQTANV